MRYVLDSNVALKWVLPESDSHKAIQVRDDFLAGVHEMLAPDVFLGEVGHSLTRLERRKLIRPPDGARKFSDILAALPAIYPSLPVSSRAYEISSQTRHGFYDCLYVALAEREGCELVTADQRLINNLGPAFPFIKSLASLP
jgi:predicted nucleic acid-binding protein